MYVLHDCTCHLRYLWLTASNLKIILTPSPSNFTLSLSAASPDPFLPPPPSYLLEPTQAPGTYTGQSRPTRHVIPRPDAPYFCSCKYQVFCLHMYCCDLFVHPKARGCACTQKRRQSTALAGRISESKIFTC
jgi:hypothetical protein